jgi:iron complex transport system substrate-binding protein
MVFARIALVAALAAGLAAPVVARTITDSAGRTVDIPDEVNTVFAAGPPASILVYALKPEALLGWPRALRDYEKPYIAEAYRELPETGRLTGRGGEANLERVLALRPDLIVDFGSVRDTYIDLADRVQEQTGIAYILIDGRFEATAESLRLVGEALGVPERGETLAQDVEATFAALDAALGAVPEEQRPRVYLARGPDGLETGLKGSSTPRSSSARADATWPKRRGGTASCRRARSR